MNIQRACVPSVFSIPNFSENIFPLQHFIGVFHEDLQQAGQAGSKVSFFF